MIKGVKRRMSVVLLTLLLTATEVLTAVPMQARAANNKVLTLQAAKKMAVANSTKIEQLENKIETKQASLKQAVKSIQLKKKNMSTFRWTPLLSFKFPEKPDLSESFEFTYKPLQIQSEIDTLNHQMTDQVLVEYEKVSNLYVDIVVYEESIAFNEQRIQVMEQTLEKNRARLLIGEANESDITSMEKSIKSLNSKVSSDKRSYESAKKKLSTAIGLDVSTGYSFPNPFKEAELSRSQLAKLKQYTLDRDQIYYDACMESTMALVALRTNNSLMSSYYSSSDMSLISQYINQALNGEKINTRAFKKQYDNFLKAVDKPWTGSYRIWFIRIPKEWLKGSIDGVRYVENEPYALYEAALAYQEARLAKEAAAEELTTSVEDGFNNYISVRNSYMSFVEEVETSKKQLEKDRIRNRMGEMTYEEYKAAVDDYEELQNSMFEALALYTQTLYSYDRLTCGGITALLSGTSADRNAAEGGESYVQEEYAEGAHYYIRPIVQEEAFELGITLPEEFEVEVTDYELWCDNVQIGKRTPVDQTIRHLGLAKQSVSKAKLRFYNGEDFVDDCEIDPSSYSGPISIVSGYQIVEGEQNEIGTYLTSTNVTTGMFELELNTEKDKEIKYYRLISADGTPLSSESKQDITKKFQYLPLLADSLDEVTIEFYDSNEQLLYTGYFDTTNQKIMKQPEEE